MAEVELHWAATSAQFVLDLRRETRSPLQGPTPAHPGVAGLQECYVTGLCQRSSPHTQASTALIHVKSRCGLTALTIVPLGHFVEHYLRSLMFP